MNSKEESSWKPDGVPFFWIPKEAFDRIEQGLERGSAATAKLVYMALCLLANREDSGTFSKPINYIAIIASLQRRTVERRLGDLQNLGLVTLERNGKGERYTFMVTTLSRNPTTLSREVTTARGSRAVALPKEQQNKRTEGEPSLGKRIGLERQLQILHRLQSQLKQDTAEQWQCDQYPDRLTELRELSAKIATVENQLLGL